MKGSAPESMAEFKRIACDYECELLHSFMGPIQVGHKLYGVKRRIVKVQSNAFQYEGGSWLDFPPASQVRFLDDGEGVFVLEHKSPDCEHPVIQRYTRR